VTVFSPATRSAAIKGAVAIVLDEHRDAIDLAIRITTAVTETLAELEAPASRAAAGLTTTERTMLHYALELAQDQIYSNGDEFTHDDQTALDTLRRVADGPDAATDTTPIVLRWDRLVMHPNDDADDQTIVACMTDDGRPAALFLDDEYREALGLQLVDPDGEAESPTPCSENYPCEGDNLCDRHEEERAHADGEHESCGRTCEVQLPSELLRNAILYRAIPGAAGMLNELLRRVAEGQDASPEACPLHSPDGDPCGCGHAAGDDCHPRSV